MSNGKESTSTVVGDKRKLTGGGDAETEEKKKLMKKPCSKLRNQSAKWVCCIRFGGKLIISGVLDWYDE